MHFSREAADTYYVLFVAKKENRIPLTALFPTHKV
jgi:hypothetical protein